MCSYVHVAYLKRMPGSGTVSTTHTRGSSELQSVVNGSKPVLCRYVVFEVLYYNSPVPEVPEPGR